MRRSKTCLQGLKGKGQDVDKFKEVLRGGGLYDAEAHS